MEYRGRGGETQGGLSGYPIKVTLFEALLYLFIAFSHFLLIVRFILITKFSFANECGLSRAEISDNDLAGYARALFDISLMLKKGRRC